MTVSVSNTNINDSFNTWRLNTNFAATVISNNAVTVSRAGSANRGGVAKGNGHVAGTFTANELRTTALKAGNTSNDGAWLYVRSNTSVNATSLTVTANTIFQGNVDFVTSGTDRVTLGDISRVRVTGGTRGQFLRIEGQTDTPNFKSLTLRDITDLSSNSAHIILSGANSTFSDNGDSPQLKFAGNSSVVSVFLAADSSTDGDLQVVLADSAGDSRLAIADSGNNVVAWIDSDGNIVSSVAFLPSADDAVDLGAVGAEFKDAHIDGVAYIDELSMATGAGQGVATSLIPKTDAVGNLGSTTRKWGTVWADTTNGGAGVFNTVGVSSTLTVNGTATFNGGFNLTGDVDIGDQTTDTLTITAQVDSNIDPLVNTQQDLGTTSNRWHNVYANNVIANNVTVDNNATIEGDLTVNGTTIIASGQAFEADDGLFNTLGVIGQFTANGNVDLGNATTDSITVTGQFDSALIPITDDTYDLGTATKQWQDIWIDGTASIDTLQVDETITVTGDATFNGDNVTIAGNTAITDSLDVGDSIDVTNSITNDGTVMLGKNGKLHANNTITNGTLTTAMLANTMNLGAGGVIHGSASQVPIIRVNKQGQVIGISNTSVAGVTSFTYTAANNDLEIGTATGVTYNATISDATTSVKGVASFDSGDFDVSSGAVSLKNATTGAVLAINGTANEVNVSRSNGTVTVGLPDDVTVTGQLDVGQNLVVAGNLIVSGTTTTVDTQTILLSDNIITLNSDETGTPSANAGISIERGTSTNVRLQWNETTDKWQVTENGTTYYNLLKDDGVYATNTHVNTVAATKMSVANTQALYNTLVANTFSTANAASLESTLNASIATKMSVANTQALANARLGATATVQLTGDVTGSASFSGNSVSISTTYNNDVVLGTDTSGNYVATITAGAGIDTSGASTGEGIAHTISIESDLRGDVTQIGQDTNDYYSIGTTQHNWFLDGAEDMRLTNNGQLDVEGSVVAHSATVSDINLKENIEKVTDAISKVQQLSGYTFNYKKDGRAGAGIIAQEVEEVMPSAVQRTEILGHDGEYLIVEYDQLTALLIESIKELKAEIDELKANK
jgi:hypothetical protein